MKKERRIALSLAILDQKAKNFNIHVFIPDLLD
jgi:hypothetical protein